MNPVFDLETQFLQLFDASRAETMTSIERMYDLYKSVEYVVKAGIPGAIVECGVWQGGAMMLVAHTLKECGDHARTLMLYDTFQGLPPPDKSIDIDSLGFTADSQWAPGWAEARNASRRRDHSCPRNPGACGACASNPTAVARRASASCQ